MSSPGQKASNIELGKNELQLRTAPTRIKWLGQGSVMDVPGGESKVHAVKNNIA